MTTQKLACVCNACKSPTSSACSADKCKLAAGWGHKKLIPATGPLVNLEGV